MIKHQSKQKKEFINKYRQALVQYWVFSFENTDFISKFSLRFLFKAEKTQTDLSNIWKNMTWNWSKYAIMEWRFLELKTATSVSIFPAFCGLTLDHSYCGSPFIQVR